MLNNHPYFFALPLLVAVNSSRFRVSSVSNKRSKTDMRLEPTNIQQIGDELAISWNDGVESFLKLELLRRACPCAACGGEPDVLGKIVRPLVKYTDESFELVGFDLVGGYALQPRWKDGHSTGIYSFTYIRRLAQANG